MTVYNSFQIMDQQLDFSHKIINLYLDLSYKIIDLHLDLFHKIIDLYLNLYHIIDLFLNQSHKIIDLHLDLSYKIIDPHLDLSHKIMVLSACGSKIAWKTSSCSYFRSLLIFMEMKCHKTNQPTNQLFLPIALTSIHSLHIITNTKLIRIDKINLSQKSILAS